MLNKKFFRLFVIFIVIGLLILPLHKSNGQTTKKLSLPLWVSDNMIFPSENSWILQGSCDSFKEVSVSFGELIMSTKADKEGIWEINFPPIESGISSKMIFICDDEIKVITNVLSGNIWLCAGQSNMAMQVNSSYKSYEANNDISSSDVRYFNGKQWIKITQDNVQNISAVAFFFAVEMEKRDGIPIGIFVTAKGGTGIESWIPEEYFPDNETGNRFRTLINDSDVLKAAMKDKRDMRPYGQHRLAKWGLGRAIPASLFNEFIRPYAQLPLAGVIWYQGESNTETKSQASEYFFWLENLISSYRKHFNNSELLFAIIQLPDYNPGTHEGKEAWKILQNTQASVVKKLKRTVLIDIKDLGDLHDIHPIRKKEVGTRTAKAVYKINSKKYLINSVNP